MIDQSQLHSQTYGSDADGRKPQPIADARQRLHRTARSEPRAVLGVVEFWLAAAGLEGDSRVDR
jgi:hypothetical protein